MVAPGHKLLHIHVTLREKSCTPKKTDKKNNTIHTCTETCIDTSLKNLFI